MGFFSKLTGNDAGTTDAKKSASDNQGTGKDGRGQNADRPYHSDQERYVLARQRERERFERGLNVSFEEDRSASNLDPPGYDSAKDYLRYNWVPIARNPTFPSDESSSSERRIRHNWGIPYPEDEPDWSPEMNDPSLNRNRLSVPGGRVSGTTQDVDDIDSLELAETPNILELAYDLNLIKTSTPIFQQISEDDANTTQELIEPINDYILYHTKGKVPESLSRPRATTDHYRRPLNVEETETIQGFHHDWEVVKGSEPALKHLANKDNPLPQDVTKSLDEYISYQQARIPPNSSISQPNSKRSPHGAQPFPIAHSSQPPNTTHFEDVRYDWDLITASAPILEYITDKEDHIPKELSKKMEDYLHRQNTKGKAPGEAGSPPAPASPAGILRSSEHKQVNQSPVQEQHQHFQPSGYIQDPNNDPYIRYDWDNNPASHPPDKGFWKETTPRFIEDKSPLVPIPNTQVELTVQRYLRPLAPESRSLRNTYIDYPGEIDTEGAKKKKKPDYNSIETKKQVAPIRHGDHIALAKIKTTDEKKSGPKSSTPTTKDPGKDDFVEIPLTRRVPALPKKAIIGESHFEIPAWVSPLYTSYGIAGPFAPNGGYFLPPREEQPGMPAPCISTKEGGECPKKCVLMRALDKLSSLCVFSSKRKQKKSQQSEQDKMAIAAMLKTYDKKKCKGTYNHDPFKKNKKEDKDKSPPSEGTKSGENSPGSQSE